MSEGGGGKLFAGRSIINILPQMPMSTEVNQTETGLIVFLTQTRNGVRGKRREIEMITVLIDD